MNSLQARPSEQAGRWGPVVSRLFEEVEVNIENMRTCIEQLRYALSSTKETGDIVELLSVGHQLHTARKRLDELSKAREFLVYRNAQRTGHKRSDIEQQFHPR